LRSSLAGFAHRYSAGTGPGGDAKANAGSTFACRHLVALNLG
jgi:hypothetical protein